MNISYKPIKRIWLWLLKKDLLIFCLFVGLATIFWWGRVMSSPREIKLEIPIIYTGISDQIVFSKDLPSSFALILRDNGRQLRQISNQDHALHINLSPYLSDTEGSLLLSSEVLRPRLQDLLPGSTSIQHINPELIESSYYVQQKKTVPIVVQSEVTIAAQHQLNGDVTVNPDRVQIFGNQHDIDSISYLKTDTIRVFDLRDSVRLDAPLIIPSGIRAHPSNVTVTWKAEPFTEKSFTLPVEAIDVPAGKHMRLFPQQVTVTVRVGISHFSDVQASDLQVISRYTEEQQYALPVEVITNNPNISNIRISPSSVEYLIHL